MNLLLYKGKPIFYDSFEVKVTGPVVSEAYYSYKEAMHVAFMDDEAYVDGYAAAKDGNGILTNPFTAGSVEFNRFVDGWCFYWSADGEALRANPPQL